MSDTKNQALFYTVFDDRTVFVGGNNYYKTRWNETPNKKIHQIFYRLPKGDYLLLREYDKYYHMIEAVKDLSGKSKGQTKIEYAYIMGLKDDKVTSYRITLRNKKNDRYDIGDITKREYNKEDKKIQGLNSQGWR